MYGHVNYLNKNYLNQGEPKQTIITSCNLVSYGGFVSHGGTPKSSKSLDHFSIEIYGDLGDPKNITMGYPENHPKLIIWLVVSTYPSETYESQLG